MKKIKLPLIFIMVSILVSLGYLIPGCNKDPITPPNTTTSNAVILHSTDRGASWTAGIIAGTSTDVDNLYGITKLNIYTLLAVGDKRGFQGVFAISRNSGTSWQVNPAAGASTLKCVFSPSNGNAVAIDSYSGTPHIFLTTNTGDSWEDITVSSTYGAINALSFSNSTNGAAVGFQGEILRTTNGGHNWTEIIPHASNESLYGISLNVNLGFAVGGTILKTTNAGASWFIVPNAPNNYFQGVAIVFNYGLFAVAVGNLGAIWRTTNGGTDWNSVTSGTNNNLYGVAADIYDYTDPIIVVGDGGTILSSADLGASWVSIESHTTKNLHGIYRQGNDCWVVGVNF